jgi:ABC-type Fe3+/spermidine/putrescine transport system ATPase subunit
MPSRGGLGGSSPRASIELSGLTKKFGEIAVDNIDLTVASGEFFSLLGPSGCGKTTTLRLIAGFEQPTSGRILLDGVGITFLYVTHDQEKALTMSDRLAVMNAGRIVQIGTPPAGYGPAGRNGNLGACARL